MMITRQHKFGFTLVEIMVAIAVSSILMLGVMQIFSSNKRANMIGGGLARVQENARFAMRKLTQDMRMAGYVGCGGQLKNHLDPTATGYSDDLFDIESATGGWEYTNGASTSVTGPAASTAYPLPPTIAAAPTTDADDWANQKAEDLHTTIQGLALPGSDVLILKWAEGGDFGFTIDGTPNNTLATTAKTSTPIEQGTIMAITDCSAGDVFMKVNKAGSINLNKGVASGIFPGNQNPKTSDWSHTYLNGAEPMFFIARAYYIGVGTSGEPALFRITYVRGTGAGDYVIDELAEGVENMQVLFGEDVNGDRLADRYVTADQVHNSESVAADRDHKQISSLKVALLVRSPSEVKPTTSGGTTYNLLGADITAPDDRRLRYVFNSTVKLRNKGLK